MVSSRIFVLKLLLAGLFGQALGNEPLIAQQDWLFPVYPDYTTTVTIGKTYHLQWDSNLKNWFSSWCAVCGDPSNVDLWVQTGHNDDSAYKIASGVNVNNTLSLPWTVNIAPKNATRDTVWVLRFVAFDATPNGISGDSISSSLFKVRAPAALLSSSSASSTQIATTSTTSISTPAATSSPPTTSSKPQSGGLTTAAQAGIGVGVGLAAILFLASCYYFFITKRSRRHHQGWSGQRPDHEQEASREQSWAYKNAPGNMEQSQNPDWAAPPHGGFSKGFGQAELPSDTRLSELPGKEHVSELDVEGRT